MGTQDKVEIKVGDLVKVVYNDNGTQTYVGRKGFVKDIDLYDHHPYELDILPGVHFSEQEIEFMYRELPGKITEVIDNNELVPLNHENKIEKDLLQIYVYITI